MSDHDEPESVITMGQNTHGGRLTDRQTAAQGGRLVLNVYDAAHESTGGIWLDMWVTTKDAEPGAAELSHWADEIGNADV